MAFFDGKNSGFVQIQFVLIVSFVAKSKNTGLSCVSYRADFFVLTSSYVNVISVKTFHWYRVFNPMKYNAKDR